jgi:hypothetical protein
MSEKTKLSKNHLVFIVRVVLKSKNGSAEMAEVTSNDILQVTEQNVLGLWQ